MKIVKWMKVIERMKVIKRMKVIGKIKILEAKRQNWEKKNQILWFIDIVFCLSFYVYIK